MRAREDRYKHPERFPELKHVKVVSDTWEGHIHKQERHISILGGMPAVLLPLLPGGDTTMVEWSEFDTQTNQHTFRIIPKGMLAGDIFTIDGISNYFSLDNGNSARSYDIKIESGVFLAGSLIETTLSELYVQNAERDRNSIVEFIQSTEE